MSLLLAVVRQPARVREFDCAAWNRFMSELRSQQLCARLSYVLEDHGLADACPEPVWTELFAQRHQVDYIQSQVRLELHRIRKTLCQPGIPVMLLKGAAYAALQLPFSRGRLFSDLDILIPRDALERAETVLTAAGWKAQKIDPYDQRYYRRWMHELPPLRHPAREIELDVHHTILPLTGRLKPRPELLWAESEPLPGSPFRHLSPEDMLLHSAAHLFQDGAIDGELNALLDLQDLIRNGLIRHGAQEAGFWDGLIRRAEQLDLGRPLYHALHFARAILGTPVPADTLHAVERFAPGPIGGAAMKALVPRVLTPRYPAPRKPPIAATLLYIRSHWLRMPPALLARHLLTKALGSQRGSQRGLQPAAPRRPHGSQ